MNFKKKCFAVAAVGMSMLPATAVMATPSGLTKPCQALYAKYAAAESPKAFAKGRTKGCGWKGAGGNVSVAEARKRANAYCVADGGDGCAVIESVR